MTDESPTESVPASAGAGGVADPRLGIEPPGGAAILGGLAAAVGLSAGITDVGIASVGGVRAALLALGYRRFQIPTHA